MRVGRRLWWIISGLCLLLCVGFIFAVYQFGWSRTGFLNKSLWDWLQLLIVPLVLAVVALIFQLATTRSERQIANERYKQDQEIAKQRYEQDQEIAKQRYEQDQQIALDKQREDLLQAYLDRMSDLLLKEKLRTSPTEEVRNVARVRTTTVLCQLNASRVSYVFAFLREAGLMSAQPNESVVSLRQAFLREAGLISAQTDNNLVSLREADLRTVNWSQANLSGANLSGANLSRANLSEANLSEANLFKAKLSEEQLKKVKSLDSATMPDGSKHG